VVSDRQPQIPQRLQQAVDKSLLGGTDGAFKDDEKVEV
jgi:hypothetical protein